MRNQSWLGVLTCISLMGCEIDLPAYIAKQGFRHGSLLLKAKSVDDILAQPNLDPKTEHYLKLSKKVITYAERNLGMKTGSSYRQYIPLNRDWVTQIVMAARKDSLTPYLFSYPIVGDLPYRGFYDEEDAVKLEKNLEQQGLDTYRRRVEAFSTTGWLPDPLVSTMFSDEARLVELLFHELTHANFYFADQADFNEAFASWMGFRSALEFVADPASELDSNKATYEAELRHGHEFQIRFAAVMADILEAGKRFYSHSDPLSQREPYFAWIRERIRREPQGAAMTEKHWNNALVLSLGTYYAQVPAIEAYALKHKLTPREFLAKVVAQGPSIVPEILALAPQTK